MQSNQFHHSHIFDRRFGGPFEISSQYVKVQPFETSPSFIVYFKMLGNSTDTDEESNTTELGVIVAVSKAHSSGKTSVIHGRKLNSDNSDDLCGEGHVFQLSQRNFLYIWENKELSKEKIRFGSVVKYRKVNDTYVYEGNTKFRRQVSSF